MSSSTLQMLLIRLKLITSRGNLEVNCDNHKYTLVYAQSIFRIMILKYKLIFKSKSQVCDIIEICLLMN